MTSYDLSSLKDYVKGGPARALGQGSCTLDIEHNLIKQRFVEIAFDTNMTIERVKEKVQNLTGTNPAYMILRLNGSIPLLQDHFTLASYGVQDGSQNNFLYVEDQDPHSLARGGGLDDVSKVEKYVMSDEDYAKRANTYRAFKNQKKAEDPTWKSIFQKKQGAGGASSAPIEPNASVSARCILGSRCEVTPGGRRGFIRYVGPIPELAPGATEVKKEEDGTETPVLPFWIGVELDEPTGKHDGSIHGKRYFQAPPRTGAFVKPGQVKVGDFAVRDPLDSDEEDEEESKTQSQSIQSSKQQEDEEFEEL